jgi:hypothetical protein
MSCLNITIFGDVLPCPFKFTLLRCFAGYFWRVGIYVAEARVRECGGVARVLGWVVEIREHGDLRQLQLGMFLMRIYYNSDFRRIDSVSELEHVTPT